MTSVGQESTVDTAVRMKLPGSTSELEASMPMMVAIKELYDRGSFTDVELVGDGGSSEDAIACHKLVLSSCSMLFRQLLRDESDLVYLPDVSHSHLRTFVTGLYQQLAQAEPQWRALDPDLLTFLQIKEKLPPKRLKLVKRIRVIQARQSDQKPLDLQMEEEIKSETLDVKDENVSPDIMDGNLLVDTGEAHDEEMDSADESRELIRNIVDFIGSEEAENIFADSTCSNKRKAKSDRVENGSSHPPKRIKTPRQAAMEKNAKKLAEPKPGSLFDTAELIATLKSRKGTLHVSHTCPPLTCVNKPEEMKQLTHLPNQFIALLGIQEQTPGQFEARPLAWTQPGPDEEVGAQFGESVQAFGHTFGIHRAHILAHRQLISGQDGGGTFRNGYANKTRRTLLTSNREEVQRSLQDSDILEAHAVPSPTHKALVLPLNDWTLQLNPELESFHELLVVRLSPHAVDARTFCIASEKLDQSSKVFLRILFLVWTGGLAGTKIPFSQHITDEYYSFKLIMYKKTLAEELLASGEDLPRNFGTFTCEVCGITIKENVFGNARAMHQKNHEIKDCGCDLGDITVAERRKHFVMEHGKGKVVSCPNCQWLGSPKALKNHHITYHERELCPECGKSFMRVQVKQHFHQVHQPYRCDVCLVEVKGRKSLKEHCQSEHETDSPEILERIMLAQGPIPKKMRKGTPLIWSRQLCGRFACEKCGKEYSSRSSLYGHLRYTHGNEEDKPFTCRLCQKKIFTKDKLKIHLMSMHIQSRPFVCRKEGCSVNFNCPGNLREHEFKLHGGLLGKLPSINLYISNEKMAEMSEVKKSYRACPRIGSE